MFDWRLLPQHEFDVPVIVVGNIAVGGTGKTPHTEYIVDALRFSYHIAVLSRGYKRATKGFVLATPDSTAADIGDESYQIYHKFDQKVVVAVCEDRVAAIKELLRLDDQINLIVLDDAFQHRYVKPSLSIVVTEFSKPLYEDKMLPYGRLRESIRALTRADMVVVSKCPDNMPELDYKLFKKKLGLLYFQKLFFSKYIYRSLMPLYPEQACSTPSLEWMTAADSVLAVAGIGNPRPFVQYLKSFLPKVRVNIFDDHHAYSRKDMEMIQNRYRTMSGAHKILVTTEKDAVRMAACPYFPVDLRPYAFYLPIKVEFINRPGDTFEESLRQLLRQNT